MFLSMANIGEENTIRRIGGNDKTKTFLESLGFVAGGNVTVVSNISGNIIVKIKEARVALNRDMANKIMI